jgi:hypothetical protein
LSVKLLVCTEMQKSIFRGKIERAKPAAGKSDQALSLQNGSKPSNDAGRR